jgi:hypothetical protein
LVWHAWLVPKDFPVVLIAIAVLLILAAVATYFALRFANRRSDNTIVMGFFLLATIFGVAAIFVVTFLGKTRSG